MPTHHRSGLPSATMSVAHVPDRHPVISSPVAQWNDVARSCTSHVKGFDW